MQKYENSGLKIDMSIAALCCPCQYRSSETGRASFATSGEALQSRGALGLPYSRLP